MHQFKKLLPLLEEYSKAVIEVYGKKSAQYVQVKKEESDAGLMNGQNYQSLMASIEAYDLAKEVYGSEINPVASQILSNKAVVKSKQAKYEESLYLLDKALEIEKQVTSANSDIYKAVLNIKTKLLLKMENIDGLVRKVRIKGYWERVKPNTPIKAALWISAVAAITSGLAYFLKKK